MKMFWWSLVLLLLPAGCIFADPAAVTKGHDVAAEQAAKVARNNRKIISGLETVAIAERESNLDARTREGLVGIMEMLTVIKANAAKGIIDDDTQPTPEKVIEFTQTIIKERDQRKKEMDDLIAVFEQEVAANNVQGNMLNNIMSMLREYSASGIKTDAASVSQIGDTISNLENVMSKYRSSLSGTREVAKPATVPDAPAALAIPAKKKAGGK